MDFALMEKWGIDPIIVGFCFFSGLFVDRFLAGTGWIWFKNERTDTAWKTLVISFIFGFSYALIVYYDKSRTEPLPLKKWLISFVFTTSVYELFFSNLVNWLKRFSRKKFGEDDSIAPSVKKDQSD